MILSTHFLAGAAVAEYTDSPLLIVTIPLTVHFILDSIPHWEYMEDEKEIPKKIPLIVLDFISGPAIIFILFLVNNLSYWSLFWLFFGGFFGILPDGMSLLYFVFPKNTFLKKIFAFHEKIHFKEMLAWKYGIPSQLLIDIVAILLITLPKM